MVRKMGATKNNSLSFYIHSAIVLIFMFLFRYLPAPEPLTAFGMNVLGIFIGAIYAWCTIGIIWPSILALILLGFSGYNTVIGCFGAAISNSTVLLIIFMCIFATLAQVSGLTNYIANKIITMKIVNGRPWVLSFMLMVACTVATALVDSVAEEAGYQKGDKWPLLMIIGIVFASIMGFSFFPFKVAVVANFGFLESAMGSTVSYSYGAYMLFNFIYAMINLVAYILVCKYILRADVSNLQNFKIEKKEFPLDKRQKITIALIVGLIICMLIPNFVPTTFWLSAT